MWPFPKTASSTAGANGRVTGDYVSIKPVANQPESAWIVGPTSGGLKAIAVWRDLAAIIERRWHERFGSDAVRDLAQALEAVVDQLDPNLPDYLPILGYELKSRVPEDFSPPRPADSGPRTLPILLSRVLLSFAIEFETESDFSLAVYANFLRIAAEQKVRVKDIPRLSGVSKEAAAMALDRLQKQGLAEVKNESSSSRLKVLAVNAEGRKKADACPKRSIRDRDPLAKVRCRAHHEVARVARIHHSSRIQRRSHIPHASHRSVS